MRVPLSGRSSALVHWRKLAERGITPTALARQLAVPANRITQLIQGKRSMSADTALRLAHWFGTDPQFWMNLQAQFDRVTARALAGKQIEALPTAGEPVNGPAQSQPT